MPFCVNFFYMTFFLFHAGSTWCTLPILHVGNFEIKIFPTLPKYRPNLLKYSYYFCLKYRKFPKIPSSVDNIVMASESTSENKTKSLSDEKSPIQNTSSSLQNTVSSSTTASQNNSTSNATTTSKSSTDSKVFFNEILHSYVGRLNGYPTYWHWSFKTLVFFTKSTC